MGIHQRVKSPGSSDLSAFQRFYQVCRTCTGRLSDPERIRWHRLLCTSKDGKAGHDIYYHLFNKYDLLPSECFFIDDTVENVIASKELGMESILFTGDIEAVKRAIEF